jgi:RHS repeat-associated protein
MVARAEYDGFGRFIKLAGPLDTANRYWFSSKEYINQANIYYYGFRFYEPNLSRWLNRDPIGEVGGINLYEFVRNRPVNGIDPFGLTTYVSDSPLADNTSGTYGPYSQTVDDGNSAVLPAVPWLTDQGIQTADWDLAAMIAPFLPESEAGDMLQNALRKPKQPCPETPKWKMPAQKGASKLQRQMQQRGWTPQDITDAIEKGQSYPAPNNVKPANSATRYVNPTTGQSVVTDNNTGEVLHVGGPGFKY